MKTTSLGIQNNNDLTQPSPIPRVRWIGLNLSIAATALCGFGSSTLAQNPEGSGIAQPAQTSLIGLEACSGAHFLG